MPSSGRSNDRTIPIGIIRLLLAAGTPLVASIAVAQSDALMVETVDEFTQHRSLHVEPKDVSQGPRFSYVSINGRCYLRVHWAQAGHRSGVIFEGDTLMVKLENNDVLVLRSAETVIGVQDKDPNGVARTTTICSYRLNPDQLARLGSFWPVKLRIYFRDGFQEWVCALDPKWQYAFSSTTTAFRRAAPFSPEPVRAKDEQALPTTFTKTVAADIPVIP